MKDGGAAGGSAVGRLAHGVLLCSLCCHSGPTQRRGRCDSSSGAAVAAKAATYNLKFGVSAAGVTPREPQANDWRGGRAELISSSFECKFLRPGVGLGE